MNRKIRAHPSHRNDGACQWVAARTVPDGAARARTSTHPRDGRAPARSDPSASLRLEGRSDGVPGASEAPPVVPEALTPEEAEARRRAKSQHSDAAGPRRSSIGVQAEAPRPLADVANRDTADRDSEMQQPEAMPSSQQCLPLMRVLPKMLWLLHGPNTTLALHFNSSTLWEKVLSEER